MNWWWGDVQHLGPIEGAPWHLLRIIGQLKKIFCKLHHKQMNESPLLKFFSLNIFRICSKRICCKQEADKVLIQVQPGAKSDYLLRRRPAISVTTDEHQLHEKFMTHYSSEELNRHKKRRIWLKRSCSAEEEFMEERRGTICLITELMMLMLWAFLFMTQHIWRGDFHRDREF